jgi:hypothetical protein
VKARAPSRGASDAAHSSRRSASRHPSRFRPDALANFAQQRGL